MGSVGESGSVSFAPRFFQTGFFQVLLHPRYILVSLDATLWPSNANYLAAAVSTACAIVNLSQDNIAHVQMPQLQSSTNAGTVLKHRRSLEDQLVNHKLDVTNAIMLRFDKGDAQRNDARKNAQVCVAATSTNYSANGLSETEAVKTSNIGPVPLIRTNQMVGYDAEDGISMSAGLRVEQTLRMRGCFALKRFRFLVAFRVGS